MSAVLKSAYSASNALRDNVTGAFVQDMLVLFTGHKQGHLERWEYAPAQYANDPAAGSDHWAALVKNPGNYYLTQGDIDAIAWAVEQPVLKNITKDVETVVELGPGSHKSLLQKTVPFLNICPAKTHYVAVDASVDQANHAANTMRQEFGVRALGHRQDYFNDPLALMGHGKTAIIMWGGSIGNIEGGAGTDPLFSLTKTLNGFAAGMRIGDVLVFGVDTEQNERKIIDAYSEAALSASVLSSLYRLKRDGGVLGNFNPSLWRHESIWLPRNGQCAHTVYSTADQDFIIAGQHIHVPAGKRFIANNSFKLTPEIIESASKASGLQPVFCLKQDAIALCGVTKLAL